MNTHASFSISFVISVEIIYGFLLFAIQQKRNCYSSLICDCRNGQSEHVWNYLLKYNVFVLVIGEKVCVVWDWVQTPTYTHSRWSVREWLSEMVLLDYYVFMCTLRLREKESSGVPRLMFVFCRSACSVVSYVCCINTTGGCCVFWLVGLITCYVHWATHKQTHTHTDVFL